MNKTTFLMILFIPSLLGCTYRNYAPYKKEKGELCIYGTAIDAKAGAIVSTSQLGIFYIEGKKSWDEKIVGKEIIVLGRLITVDHGLEKADFQNISGLQKIVIKAKWKLADDDSWKI